MPLHLQKRGGVWHYSRTVPPDIRPILGAGRYWRFSLKTKNIREAEAQRSQFDAQYQAQIDEIRKMTDGQKMHRIRTQKALPKLAAHIPRVLNGSHEGLRPAKKTQSERTKWTFGEFKGATPEARAAYDEAEKGAVLAAYQALTNLNDNEQAEIQKAGGIEKFYRQTRKLRAEMSVITAWNLPAVGDEQEVRREARSKLLARKEAILVKLNLQGRAEFDVPETPDNPRLLSALESWLERRPRKRSTAAKYKLHIGRLADFIGNVPISALNSDTIAAFVEAYAELPNARGLKPSQRKLGMTDLLALRKFNTQLPPMGAVNVRKMTDYLRAFLKAMKREDLLAAVEKPLDTRPYEKQREGYPSISPLDMRRLLPAVDEEFGPDSDIAWWTYLLAYSGMRPEEGAQLARNNIRKIGEIWTIKIDDLDGRRVKNKKSLRTIPIHPALIELGFIDFAEPDPQTRSLLFRTFEYDDKGGRSNNPSRRLKRLFSSLNIDGYGSAHRFRATFIDAMRNADVSYVVGLGLVGHGDKNPVHGEYGSGPDLRTMARALERVDPLADP